MSDDFISLAEVLDFVQRTEAKGVPVRVALTRAARHYQVPRDWLLAAWREMTYANG